MSTQEHQKVMESCWTEGGRSLWGPSLQKRSGCDAPEGVAPMRAVSGLPLVQSPTVLNGRYDDEVSPQTVQLW